MLRRQHAGLDFPRAGNVLAPALLLRHLLDASLDVLPELAGEQAKKAARDLGVLGQHFPEAVALPLEQHGVRFGHRRGAPRLVIDEREFAHALPPLPREQVHVVGLEAQHAVLDDVDGVTQVAFVEKLLAGGQTYFHQMTINELEHLLGHVREKLGLLEKLDVIG